MPGTQSTPRTEESREGMSTETSPRQGGGERQGSGSGRQDESSQRQGGSRQGSSRTAGTNRDFDESGESINQGHGHTRGDRASQAPMRNE